MYCSSEVGGFPSPPPPQKKKISPAPMLKALSCALLHCVVCIKLGTDYTELIHLKTYLHNFDKFE